MLSASAFVLTALTMTGIYVREKNKDDGEYRVELDDLDNTSLEQGIKDYGLQSTPQVPSEVTLADDLDADPFFQETNSKDIKNPQFESKLQGGLDSNDGNSDNTKTNSSETTPQSTESDSTDSAATATPETNPVTENKEALSTSAMKFTFPQEQIMQLPAAGSILINYSMDKPVYFKTLNQYKYSPYVVLSAAVGDQVSAAAAGIVKSVSSTSEFGNIVVFDLGEGYELTYGQLGEIAVTEGDVVEAGQFIGVISQPTMFYSMEGSNLYMKMTYQGQPENPLAYMQ